MKPTIVAVTCRYCSHNQNVMRPAPKPPLCETCGRLLDPEPVSNVVNLPCITTHDLSTERVLTAALRADLEGVIVMGYAKDGEVYFASTYADGGNVMWLMEWAKRQLLKQADAIRDGTIQR